LGARFFCDRGWLGSRAAVALSAFALKKKVDGVISAQMMIFPLVRPAAPA
jgi:hypothetical protein